MPIHKTHITIYFDTSIHSVLKNNRPDIRPACYIQHYRIILLFFTVSWYLKRAVIRGFAFILAFAYTIKYILLVDLFGERFTCKFLHIRLKRRNAKHLPACKPIADRSGRKALKETFLACEIHMHSNNKLS